MFLHVSGYVVKQIFDRHRYNRFFFAFSVPLKIKSGARAGFRDIDQGSGIKDVYQWFVNTRTLRCVRETNFKLMCTHESELSNEY